MKNKILFTLLMILVVGSMFINMLSFVSSQDEETKAGITINSIFWIFDRTIEKIQLLLTFNVVKKAELRLKIADERLAEIEVLIKKNKIKAREKAEKSRENEIKKLGELSDEIKEETNKTIINILENLQKHIDRLKQVKERAPEDAQEGLANAIDKSSKVLKKFVECIQNDNCGEGEVCINNSCQVIVCGYCQYIRSHECIDYKCCEDSDCGEGENCTEHECVAVEEDTTPLTINITYPLNSSTIKANSVYVKAKTNKMAICQYAEEGGVGDSILKQMDITDGILHLQLMNELQSDEHFIIKLSCTDDFGNLQTDSTEFWIGTLLPDKFDLTGKYKKFIGDDISSLLRKTKLPNLLKDGVFNFDPLSGGTTISEYLSYLYVGGKRIEKSISNGDLDSPEILIEVGTDPNNYLYKYKLTFLGIINLTRIRNEGMMRILGENYMVNKSSTNQKIVLNKVGYDSTIVLERNQPIKVNDEIISGTYVEFNDLDNRQIYDYILIVEIYFAMQDPKKDYIAVGESYDDPVFKSIRLTFESYSEEEGAKIYIGSTKGY